MQHNSPAASRKIRSLQALRAYAAISVMLGHGILEFHATNGTAMPFNEFPLIAGVDIFFVLSGFVMFHTSEAMFGQPGAVLEFWRRRFIRLVPLYWLFTSLMVAVLLSLGNHVRSTQFDLWNIISSYIFIPSERPGGRIAPILSLGWTLNYEMFFYLMFGMFLSFDKRKGVMGLILVFAAFAMAVSLHDPGIAALRFWGNSIIFEFIAGMLLGVLRNRWNLQKSLPFCFTIFALGLAILILGSDLPVPRFVKGGIPAALMVYAALALPMHVDRKIPDWLVLLGDSSYALYLSHRFVLRAVTMLFSAASIGSGNAVYLYALTTLIGSISLSILVYKFIESPWLRLMSAKGKAASGATPFAVANGDAPVGIRA